ncbi:asparagine synthetase B family protein [Streptomyces sp. NPDC006923]|uniref:asparagine synthetase B family protein n=1 Tax=Streptomyces sp. NPDC006923 TaxID=3155355 RepID=UPI0033E5848F
MTRAPTAASRPRPPYLRLEHGPDGTRAEGVPSARLGHRLRRAGRADEGVFAEWRWDGERLLVRNDRYGMFPLYYWADGDRIALATSPTDLPALGAPAGLDHDALSVFLRLGFYLGEDTCFAAVRALPPAATLTWSAGALRLESGRAVPAPATRMTRREAVDGLIELFRAAVARRLPGEPYVLPLSGGRDSRHLLLELARQGAAPRLCVSGSKFPPDTGADAPVAAELAARLGIPHLTLDRPASEFHAELVANRAQGLSSVEGAWALPVLDHLRHHTRITYDGLGGDALARPAPALSFVRDAPLDATDLPGEAGRLLLAGRTGPHVEHLLSPALGRLWSRDRARRRLATELAGHTGAAFPAGSFYFWNRTRRAVALTPYRLVPGGPLIHAPYLDHDLFDHLASVPERLLTDGGLHDEALRRAFPHHASLRFAGDGPPASTALTLRHRAAYLRGLLGHALYAEPGWWRGGDRMLLRLLAGGRGRPGPQRVSRLMPLTLYLLQLESLAAGFPTGSAPRTRSSRTDASRVGPYDPTR